MRPSAGWWALFCILAGTISTTGAQCKLTFVLGALTWCEFCELCM